MHLALTRFEPQSVAIGKGGRPLDLGQTKAFYVEIAGFRFFTGLVENLRVMQ